jgi:hypothetical protein
VEKFQFFCHTVFHNNYAMSIELSSTLNGIPWIQTNIYAPCTPDGQMDFLNWFNSIDMLIDTDWLLVGDFNLLRCQSGRNKLGGNITKMLCFNGAINNIRLEVLKLYGNWFI